MNVTSETRHMTGSAVVVDVRSKRILLIHHKATGLWMFPGGHVKPDEALHEAAIREVLEETGVKASISTFGIKSLPGMTVLPVPIIVAEIPAPPKPERPGKPAEPAHSHLDFLYVATADEGAFLTHQEDEVNGARWADLSAIHWLHDNGESRAEVLTVARMVLAGDETV
jgi:8-oxo-dGTP pyrophosphatase MutT (NUDIX family)